MLSASGFQMCPADVDVRSLIVRYWMESPWRHLGLSLNEDAGPITSVYRRRYYYCAVQPAFVRSNLLVALFRLDFVRTISPRKPSSLSAPAFRQRKRCRRPARSARGTLAARFGHFVACSACFVGVRRAGG